MTRYRSWAPCRNAGGRYGESRILKTSGTAAVAGRSRRCGGDSGVTPV